MQLPRDFPGRFFNPLVSKHREDYIYVLLTLESVLAQEKRIALQRKELMENLRKAFHRENYSLNVSDEEEYDEQPTSDPEQDNLAFTIRVFLRSGWIDVDEGGDYQSELIFLTQYGKKLTGFIKDLAKSEDQSGYVINTLSNLREVRNTPENGFICISNAHESTQHLLMNIEMVYARIRQYYGELLKRTKPEDLLSAHLHGYVKDVVDKIIFPLKVDDSVDRFRGPILSLVSDIESDTHLLNQIVSAAVQTKRVPNAENGMEQLLKMINYIKSTFDDIESYIQQLDEKNQTYIRITRQKLSYMLNRDTSIRGDIISILHDAKERQNVDPAMLSSCFNLYDVQQITDDSFYRLRRKRVRTIWEDLGIEVSQEVDKEEIIQLMEGPGAQYTSAKIFAYAEELLKDRESVEAYELPLENDEDYLMAIHLALYSTDYRCPYLFEAGDQTLVKNRYCVPAYTIRRKEHRR